MIDEIANAFGIDTLTEYPTKSLATLDDVDSTTRHLQVAVRENINKDYRFVRQNLTNMIESTMVMIPNLVDLVQQAESARMYESAAAFLKMVADLNKDLINTSKELDKGVEAKTPKAPEDTANGPTNIFIGTAGDVFSRLSKPKMELESLPVINK